MSKQDLIDAYYSNDLKRLDKILNCLRKKYEYNQISRICQSTLNISQSQFNGMLEDIGIENVD
jgi:hypothetical protein